MPTIEDIPDDLIEQHPKYKRLKKKYDNVCHNAKELEKSCNDLSDMVYDLCDVIKKLENDLDEANGMIDDLLGNEDISSNEENLELESFEDILEAASEAKNKIPKKLKSVEIDFDPFKKKLGLYFHMGSKN